MLAGKRVAACAQVEGTEPECDNAACAAEGLLAGLLDTQLAFVLMVHLLRRFGAIEQEAAVQLELSSSWMRARACKLSAGLLVVRLEAAEQAAAAQLAQQEAEWRGRLDAAAAVAATAAAAAAKEAAKQQASAVARAVAAAVAAAQREVEADRREAERCGVPVTALHWHCDQSN